MQTCAFILNPQKVHMHLSEITIVIFNWSSGILEGTAKVSTHQCMKLYMYSLIERNYKPQL